LFNGKAEIRINPEALHRKVGASTREAQAWLDSRVLKDSDPFVPMDTGMLAQSGRRSVYGSGIVAWLMPYARRLYYGVRFNFSTDNNPKATHHWFEKAKTKFLSAWGQGVAKIQGGTWRRGA